MKKIVYFLLLMPNMFFAQDKGALSFEFDYNSHDYALNELNEYLIDPNYFGSVFYSSTPTDQIDKGQSFNFSTSYQPLKFAEFGVYGSYQFAKVNRKPRYLEDLDPVWNPGENVITHEGDYTMQVSSYGIGIITTFFINQILNFEQKNSEFVKRTLIGVELRGGAGFATVNETTGFASVPFEFGVSRFKSNGFSGRVALKVGYNFLKKPIISSVGFKIGYQFYETSALKNSIDQDFPIFNETTSSVSLDLSGLFVGAFIKLGK